MSDKHSLKITEGIKTLAQPVEHTVMSGKVQSVDEDASTCDVILNMTGIVVYGVLLHGVDEETTGMIHYPALNSDVSITNCDGPGEYVLLKASILDKVKLTIGKSIVEVTDGKTAITIGDAKVEMASDGSITLNGGKLDGLPIVGKLLQKINALEKDLNTLKTIFKTWVVAPTDGGGALYTLATSWASQNITLTQQSDIENIKIKQ